MDLASPDDLHARGLALIHDGRPADALPLLDEAAARVPDNPDYHHNRGVALAHLQRLPDAVAAFEAAIRLKPDGPSAYSNMGLALAQQGKTAEAIAAFETALKLDPESWDTRHRLGNCHRNAKNPAAALPFLVEAAERNPTLPELHHSVGLALADLGRNDDAVAAYRESLRLAPDNPDVLNNLGIVLQNTGKSDESIACYRASLRVRPHSSETYNNLGVALAGKEAHEDAVTAYRAALQIFPDSSAALSNLGNAFRQIGLVDDALDCLTRALELNPEYAEGHNNLAVALVQAARPADAVPAYDKALALKPDYPDAYLNRALAKLLLDDYDTGLPDYERRWERPGKHMPDWGRPVWDGSDPVGRTILLWGEQGLGDSIQYCRFAIELTRRGGTALLCVPEPLVRLLKSVPTVPAVAVSSDKLPAYSCHFPLMSAMHRFGMRTLNDAPWPGPYITPVPEEVERCRDTVRAGADLVVGIVWKGNPGHGGDRIRSVSAATFAPVVAVPGVRFVSFQKGATADELTVTGAADIGAEGWADFGDTAAALANVDLLITVDTAVGHLAGAMGKPVWIALPTAPDWRWGSGRTDSPWYPSARLFRQSKRGKWADVFARMGDELAVIARLKADPASVTGTRSPADLLHDRGLAALKAGDLPAAAGLLADAAAAAPDSAGVHLNYGVALAQQKRLDEAVRAFRRAADLDPESALAHANLGLALVQADRHAEALPVLDTAARLDPASADVHNHRGIALAHQGRHAEATEAYHEAVRLKPGYHAPHTNLGNLLRDQGRLEDALDCYAKAIDLCPGDPEVFNNRGVALDGLRETEKALADYERALALNTEHAETRFNRALALLLQGDYDRGADEYEWRWKRPNKGMPDWGVPAFDGRPVPGQTILLWAEQGLGDTIQFSRFAIGLAKQDVRVLVHAPPPLVRLLETLPGVGGVVRAGDPLPKYDAHAPLMSFMKLTNMKTAADAPWPGAYLSADTDAAAAVRDSVRAGAELVIGVAWRGNPGHAGDRLRSVRPEAFAVLSNVPGVRVVSLQKGAAADEVRSAGAVEIGSDGWADFADTAAVVANLDLVASVDTAAAHLAGAMNVPAWVAVPTAPDWRWAAAGERTPWYPSVRLFRQTQRAAWDDVFARMADELAMLAAAEPVSVDLLGVPVGR